ncbi:MAG: RNA polymerase sigma factor RpoD/SigA [Candidatus Latescibacteria bacterium]|jgi:RNA polymerase primary sigma factor|nr:RNA polymerase sigma factor RpoD/SigA [Candidatus Latescibacterota bacterium]
MSGKPFSGDDRNLHSYFRAISVCEPLSRTRESELSDRIQQGDKAARDELVRANLRFVIEIAKRYRHRGLSLSELISAGNMGLLTAADRFEAARGVKFISYAVWWIKQAIISAIATEVRPVRLPMNKITRLQEIGAAKARLRECTESEATIEKIAAELKLPFEEVVETLQSGDLVHSLEDTMDDIGNRRFIDILADEHQSAPDAVVEEEEGLRQIDVGLACLDERDRYIVRKYYGLGGEEPLTLEKIGGGLGLTRERVRQLKQSALIKLRHSTSLQLLG